MAPELPPDGTLELDGLWTRTRRGRAELKVIHDAVAGTGLGAFRSWAEVIDRAWQLEAQHPKHLVSDGDGAIAAGIELVYGGEAPHQLCAFTCCESTGGTLGWRDLRRRGGCWTRAVSGGRSGMGAADYAGDGWGGVILVLASVVQRTAPFDYGAGGATDDVAFGAAQS